MVNIQTDCSRKGSQTVTKHFFSVKVLNVFLTKRNEGLPLKNREYKGSHGSSLLGHRNLRSRESECITFGFQKLACNAKLLSLRYNHFPIV